MRPSEINLPYGLKTVEPNLVNYKTITKDELSIKIHSSQFIEFVTSEDTLCIINDGHRATPSNKILQEISKIEKHRIKALIIATGTHSSPTHGEIASILGGIEDHFTFELLIHDSTSEDLVYIGKTTRGTEVKVNPIILEYKHILCINSVEPHYFAGFTGGIKSVIPGLAAKSTVERNHSWALDVNSEPLNITTNPLPIDLWEMRDMFQAQLFGIQMVSVGSEIYGLHVGELREAFLAAVEQSSEILSIKLPEKYDVILSIVYPPLDRSLYQAQKGIENTRQALNPGGELILLADCREGIGNTAFYDTIKQYTSPEDVMKALNRENYRFGDHKAYKFASIAMESTLTLVGNIDENQCKQLYAKFLDISQVGYYLSEMKNKGKSILVVLDSGTLVVTT